MKMHYISAMVILSSVFCYNAAESAAFTVSNKGTKDISVSPLWSGRPEAFDVINPGQSKGYDSGFNNVTGFRWHQSVPSSVAGTVCYKNYQADAKVGALNLGGKFEILDEGSYTYYFGVDGSGSGVGK